MAEKFFKKKVIPIDKQVDTSFFPKKFLNEIYHSKVDAQLDLSLSYTSNFSIKYVLGGEELYFIDGRKYTPKAGQYLIINDGRQIDTIPTKGSEGLSIFLDKKLITEVYHVCSSKEETLLDDGLSDSKIPNLEFFENNFSHHDVLGETIRRLAKIVKMTPQDEGLLQKETYYLIAEKLIQTQKNIVIEIDRIARAKKSTRDELYRKVLLARDYIHDNMLSDFNLDMLSKHVGLSKYHLIHIFKSVYFNTPYQYYLHCKVDLAKGYLQKRSNTLGEIAYLCGFNDIFAFSKTFKKITGDNPSTFRDK